MPIRFCFIIIADANMNGNEKALQLSRAFRIFIATKLNKDMSNLIQDSEIWKDIPNYEGIYQISNKGRVKSILKNGVGRKKRDYILSNCLRADGKMEYPSVRLCINGKPKKNYIHRLMASAFIPNPENKPIINHKDGNKSNNSLDNLEWCDYSHNINHAYQNNLRAVGESHHKAKFTNKDVLQIRADFANGINRKEIMNKFNLSQNQYARIVYKRTWKHI